MYSCHECGGDNVVVRPETTPCCTEHGSMRKYDQEGYGVRQPSLEEVLNQVFGFSTTQKDILIHLTDEGFNTISGIASEFDLDRTTVSRHVNKLHEIGLITKNPKNLKEGGSVNVYSARDPEEVLRILRNGLYHWVAGALASVELLREEEFGVNDPQNTEDRNGLGIYWE